MIVNAVAGRILYSGSNGFRLQAFSPIHYKENLHVHEEYGTITVRGILPDFELGNTYTLLVDYEYNGGYHNYNYQGIHTAPKDTSSLSENSSFLFLKEVLSEELANRLLDTYPDIINRIVNEIEVDLSKLSGIRESTYVKIKNKVLNNFPYFDLIVEFADSGISLKNIVKLFNKYGSCAEAIKNIYLDPYRVLYSLDRVGFKTADKIVTSKFPDMIDCKDRCRAAIEFVMNQNETNGNSWINLRELYENVDKIAKEAMEYFFNILENDETLVFNSNSDIVYSKRALGCEIRIANMIKNLITNSESLGINYYKYNKVGDIILTDEQMKILELVNNNNISILAGVGGSGKSFSVQALINMLEDNNISYKLMTPTGKSSKVLRQYINREVTTIHKALEYDTTRGKFERRSSNPFYEDVIIIDEFSMIDIYLLESILQSVEVGRTRILFIGDPFQIPSVRVGNIAFDMISSKIIPTAKLTKVFRYNEGGLSYVATKVRNGEKYIEESECTQGFKSFGINEDYVFINIEQEQTNNLIEQLIEELILNGQSIDDLMILTSYNKGDYGIHSINKIVQNFINPNKEGIKVKRFNEEIEFRVGDKVMQTSNYYKCKTIDGYELPVFNGDIGTIIEIKDNKIIIKFDDIDFVFSKADFNQLELAYAITIHKSQGSAANNVILVTPKAHKGFLNRNLLYVAVSRAKKQLWHIGSIDVLNSTLKKSANFNRNTSLGHLLKDVF